MVPVCRNVNQCRLHNESLVEVYGGTHWIHGNIMNPIYISQSSSRGFLQLKLLLSSIQFVSSFKTLPDEYYKFAIERCLVFIEMCVGSST